MKNTHFTFRHLLTAAAFAMLSTAAYAQHDLSGTGLTISGQDLKNTHTSGITNSGALAELRVTTPTENPFYEAGINGSIRLYLEGTGNTFNLRGGTNAFTGGLVIDNANVESDYAQQLGSGGITLKNGHLGAWSREVVYNDTVTLDGGGGLRAGSSGGQITLAGKVTGTGDLWVCYDGGTVMLSNGNNDYTGNTLVGDSRWSWSDAALLRVSADYGLPKTTTVILGGSRSILSTQDRHQIIRGLTGTGTLTNGYAYWNAERMFSTITFDVPGDAAPGTADFTNITIDRWTAGGAVYTDFDFEKTGSGVLNLVSKAGVFTRPFTLKEGSLRIDSRGGTIAGDQFLVTGDDTGLIVDTSGGNVTAASDFVIDPGKTFTVSAVGGGTANITGTLSGGGSLSFSADGSNIFLAQKNTYEGRTVITTTANGRVVLGTDNALPIGTTLVLPNVNNGSLLNLNAHDQEIFRLEGAGYINNSSFDGSGARRVTLTVSEGNFTGYFGSEDNWNITLKKVGSGLLTLGGDQDNRYGIILVQGGTLEMGKTGGRAANEINEVAFGATIKNVAGDGNHQFNHLRNLAGTWDLNGFSNNTAITRIECNWPTTTGQVINTNASQTATLRVNEIHNFWGSFGQADGQNSNIHLILTGGGNYTQPNKANYHTGGTTINAGNITAVHQSTFGTGAVTMANAGSTLTLNFTGDNTFKNPIGGTGNLDARGVNFLFDLDAMSGGDIWHNLTGNITFDDNTSFFIAAAAPTSPDDKYGLFHADSFGNGFDLAKFESMLDFSLAGGPDGWLFDIADNTLWVYGNSPGPSGGGDVPEPSTYLLLLAGLAGIAAFRRNKKN